MAATAHLRAKPSVQGASGERALILASERRWGGISPRNEALHVTLEDEEAGHLPPQ